MINERNYGIDLLRIISMLSIVCLHILGHGGVLDNLNFNSFNYYLIWFIEILAYPAVNCYALISGYVGINSNYKYRNIFKLWLQVLFYSLTLTIIFFLLKPETIDYVDLIKSCLPVIFERYWYFTSYFCMYLFIPIFNYLVNNYKRSELKKTIIIMILLFSIITTFSHIDVFYTRFGYSSIWLSVLYVIGAYIRKYNVFHNVEIHKIFSAYTFNLILTFSTIVFIGNITNIVLNKVVGELFFVGYTSPLILASSILLLTLFSKIDVLKYKRFLNLVSPTTFGVYLIHDNILVRENLIFDKFGHLVDIPSINLVLTLLFFIIIIYIGCTLIEYIRLLIFNKFEVNKKVNKFINAIEEKLIKYNI